MREYINGNIRYITNAHGIIRCEWVKPERFMFLSDLSVNIDKRRKGYGRKLMEYVLQLAKSTACEVVTLRVKGSEQWLVNGTRDSASTSS